MRRIPLWLSSMIPGFARVAAPALLLVLAGAPAAAQACLGVPSRDGDMAASALYGRGGGDNTFGARVHVDATGPVSLEIGYAHTDADEGVDEYMARAAWEFYLVDPTICAVAGLSWRGADEDRLGMPLGVAFGKTIHRTWGAPTIYAIPQYVWVREDDENDDPSTRNAFEAEAGVTATFGLLHVGGAVLVGTLEDDPRLMLRAGLLF